MLITVSDSDVDDDDGDMNNSNRGIYSVNCHYACMSNPFDRLKKRKSLCGQCFFQQKNLIFADFWCFCDVNLFCCCCFNPDFFVSNEVCFSKKNLSSETLFLIMHIVVHLSWCVFCLEMREKFVFCRKYRLTVRFYRIHFLKLFGSKDLSF